MKYLKFYLLILILFLVPSVYCADVNVNNYVSATISGSTGKYRGTEYYNTGTQATYNIGTRYNGRLSYIEFYIDLVNGYQNIEPSTSYTLTLNMASEDWRNNFMGPQVYGVQDNGSISTGNLSTSFSFVSMKKIKLSFRTGSTLYPHLKFVLYSTNINTTGITGVNNWKLESIILSDPNAISGGSGGSSSTPTPTPSSASNQDIIDSNNQNTQDIIDSNNQNTQDIIENNNQNTQQIIDNQNQLMGNVCKNLLKSENLVPGIYYVGSGSFGNSVGNTATQEKIQIDNTKNYILYTSNTQTDASFYVMFYDENENYLGNISKVLNNNVLYLNSFSSYSSAKYVNFRFDVPVLILKEPMFVEGDTKITYCAYGTAISSKLDDINNTMKDSSIDDKTGFFTNFQDNSHGLTSIITAPLTTIQSLANTSCASLSVPIPFTNSNVSLPCMTEVYEDYIPTVFNLWQIVSFGIISYFICIDIFKMVKGFKDPNEDKVEVLDL